MFSSKHIISPIQVLMAREELFAALLFPLQCVGDKIGCHLFAIQNPKVGLQNPNVLTMLNFFHALININEVCVVDTRRTQQRLSTPESFLPGGCVVQPNC